LECVVLGFFVFCLACELSGRRSLLAEPTIEKRYQYKNLDVVFGFFLSFGPGYTN
jgi:hypothetical protein